MTTESAGGRTYKFGVGDRLRVAREVAGLILVIIFIVGLQVA